METQNQKEWVFPLKSILQNEFGVQILKKVETVLF